MHIGALCLLEYSLIRCELLCICTMHICSRLFEQLVETIDATKRVSGPLARRA